ncbi:hypothetical protein MRX96_021411 [Rhipicephalus microplus]
MTWRNSPSHSRAAIHSGSRERQQSDARQAFAEAKPGIRGTHNTAPEPARRRAGPCDSTTCRDPASATVASVRPGLVTACSVCSMSCNRTRSSTTKWAERVDNRKALVHARWFQAGVYCGSWKKKWWESGHGLEPGPFLKINTRYGTVEKHQVQGIQSRDSTTLA